MPILPRTVAAPQGELSEVLGWGCWPSLAELGVLRLVRAGWTPCCWTRRGTRALCTDAGPGDTPHGWLTLWLCCSELAQEGTGLWLSKMSAGIRVTHRTDLQALATQELTAEPG